MHVKYVQLKCCLVTQRVEMGFFSTRNNIWIFCLGEMPSIIIIIKAWKLAFKKYLENDKFYILVLK